MAKKKKRKGKKPPWKRQYVVPLKQSDSLAEAQALARELGGTIEGDNIVFEALDNQAAANAKLKKAALRVTMKGE